MRFSETDISRFMEEYKNEYGENLEKQEALVQLQKLTSLIAMLVLPESVYKTIAQIEDEDYNKDAVQKKLLQKLIECKEG